MSTDRAKIEDVFAEASGMPNGPARTAYLDQACGDGIAIRRRVEALLAAHDSAASFLGLPDEIDPSSVTVARLAEGPGARIGRYKLLEKIGEGGFGVVFMAEQEAPVRRRVALKIIKAGMDTRQVVARFEAERQALAMMDHPNIARVFDAGATDTGRPYFVMELVTGIPITNYCDDEKLSTDARLNLFTVVCSAVQHAHQKGVIHRDLKPSNVLVTLYDDKPIPKIIDFGIAKATQARLTEKTLFTEFRQLIGTPAYMSPEQAQIIGVDVDTRSDIYSLGVLLYELLTGTPPFESKQLLRSGYDEMRRIIREVEPPRPSTRFSTFAGDDQIARAVDRSSDPTKLGSMLRGDLDWIAMKCLEKDRTRRYDTAEALSTDIERYLSDQPVHARPPSTLYRFGKFARRNKVALAFAALFVFGFIFLAFSNIAIRKERDAKASALADAKVVSDLLQSLLASTFPNGVKNPEYPFGKVLDDFTEGLELQLTDQPEVEAAIRSVIGKSYWRLGRLDQAEFNLAKAIDLRRKLYGNTDQRVANSLIEYSWVAAEQGRYAEAGNHCRDALAVLENHFAERHAINAAAEALYVLALVRLQQADTDGYRASCQRLINLPPVSGTGIVENSRPVWPLCLVPNALDDMSRLVKRAERFAADNDGENRHFALYVLGAALYRAGEYERAAQQLVESIEIYPTSPGHGCDTINYQRLLLAMTNWKLGHEESARQILTTTNPSVEMELRAPSTVWNRRTSLELLRNEAESLIGDVPKNDRPKTG